MKDLFLFITTILFLCSSCEKTFISDEDLFNQQPYQGKVRSISNILQNGVYSLIAKNVGGGTNYYFKNNSENEAFLFLTCDLDCNESIEKKEWHIESNSFAILIRSKFKTNFESKNRLILYSVVNDMPVELLDTVKDVYKSFRFEGNKFVYTLENGSEKSIILN